MYDHKILFRPANKERLYLDRDNFERNLKLVEHRYEAILFSFNEYLNKNKETNFRKLNILKII